MRLMPDFDNEDLKAYRSPFLPKFYEVDPRSIYPIQAADFHRIAETN